MRNTWCDILRSLFYPIYKLNSSGFWLSSIGSKNNFRKHKLRFKYQLSDCLATERKTSLLKWESFLVLSFKGLFFTKFIGLYLDYTLHFETPTKDLLPRPYTSYIDNISGYKSPICQWVDLYLIYTFIWMIVFLEKNERISLSIILDQTLYGIFILKWKISW